MQSCNSADDINIVNVDPSIRGAGESVKFIVAKGEVDETFVKFSVWLLSAKGEVETFVKFGVWVLFV